MSVAYLMEQGASVHVEGERLLVRKGTTLLHTLHLFRLEHLVVLGRVSLTPVALAVLLKRGVDTAFLTRSGRYLGRLQPPHGKNILLRREQFLRFSDDAFALALARAIVEGKLTNMRTQLQRFNRSREGLKLEEAIRELRTLALRTQEAQTLDSLRGLEGRGTALYFEGFSQGFLAEGVVFKRRVRRPPTDPVNALLSLGYTFLFNVVLAALNATGLDPYWGCLHTVDYGRPSLALDLMEEWRPIIVDTLVVSLFNLRVLKEADFTLTPPQEPEDEDEEGTMEPEREDGPDTGSPAAPESTRAAEAGASLPVRLTDAGFRKFIGQFERKMAEKVHHPRLDQTLTYRECIAAQVRHLARVIKGEDARYSPMVLK